MYTKTLRILLKLVVLCKLFLKKGGSQDLKAHIPIFIVAFLEKCLE